MDVSVTVAEIKERFPGEWVLLGDPEFNERREPVRGQVLRHGNDKEELYRKDAELRPRFAAYLFTGQ
jgi:hypothetical protein